MFRDSQSSSHCRGLGHARDSMSEANLRGHTFQSQLRELSSGLEEAVQMRTRVLVNLILP